MALGYQIDSADARHRNEKPVDYSDDRHVLAPIKLTEEQYRAAALFTAAHATDADDCRMLLEALGLVGYHRPVSTRLDGKRPRSDVNRSVSPETLTRYRRLVAEADRLRAQGLPLVDVTARLGAAESTLRKARAVVRRHDARSVS